MIDSADAAYVREIFPGCLQAGKSWDEVELCVKTAVQAAGYQWSFTIWPDKQKTATDAYWEFQNLQGQTLFDAAQKFMKEHNAKRTD